MNSAIIVAAGSGKRFGSEIPKQFLNIQNKPILIHTLEKFQVCESIHQIILVLSEDMIDEFSEILQKYEFSKLKKIVAGGKSRSESVFFGLQTIETEEDTDIIAIHDGARPLVTPLEISETIRKANDFGASCLVADVTDTIKEVVNGKIVNTIDRKRLRRALTPQCFRFEIIKQAFKENDIDEIATDECFLVEKLGFEIAEVKGNPRNIKITHAEDLLIADLFLRKKS